MVAGEVGVVAQKSVLGHYSHSLSLVLVEATDATHVAHNALVGSAEAQAADVLVGNQLVEVGLPHAEEVGLLAVLLGEPPAVCAVDDAVLEDRGDLGLEAALAEHVVDLNPVAVGDAVLGSGLGVDLDPRPGIDLAQGRDMAVLGVEGAVAAGTGGGDQRVLLGDGGAGVALGRPVRLVVVRQRVLAPGFVQDGVGLDLAGDGVEAGLAVEAQQALLVLLVLEAVCAGLVEAELLEGLPVEAELLELVGEELVDCLGELLEVGLVAHAVVLVPGPPLGVQAGAEHQADLDVGLGLADLQCLVHGAHEHGVAAVVGQDDAVMLCPGGDGEEVVAHCHGGRGLHDVLDDAALDGLAQCVVPALGLGGAGGSQEVGGVEPCEAQLVGLVGLHGVQGLVRGGGGHAGGQAGPLLGADALLPDLVGHGAALVHAPLAEQCGRGTEGQAARAVDGAGECCQDDHCLGQLDAVLVLVECQAPSPADGALGADDVGGAADVLSGDSGDLGDLVDGILSSALLDLVETVDPGLSELMVVLVVLEHQVHQAESHGGVGLGAQLQVDVAVMGADPGDAGVDGDDVGAELHHVDEAVAEEAVAVGGQGLLAPDNNPLGEGVAGVMVRAGQVACVVELGVAGAEDVVGHGATGAVARPAGLGVAAVGGLQHGEGQRVVVDASLAAGATEADDGLGAVGVLVVADLVADLVESLCPGDALPLVLAAILIGALHGVDDTILGVGVLAHSKVHSVDATGGDGVVVVALDADELAVLGHDLDAVSNGMGSRRRPGVAASDDGTVFKLGTPLLSISHVVLPFLSILWRRFLEAPRGLEPLVTLESNSALYTAASLVTINRLMCGALQSPALF